MEPRFEIFNLLDTPIWIHHFDRNSIIWANTHALELWSSASVEELSSRDFSSDMSETSRARQESLRRSLEAGERAVLSWTFYPKGEPVHLQLTCSHLEVDGDSAMLVEAQPARNDILEKEMLWSVSALRYAPILIAVYDEGGRELIANPAHIEAFGEGLRFEETWIEQSDAQQLRTDVAKHHQSQAKVPAQTLQGRRWHEIDARLIQDPVEGGANVLVSRVDVTDRVRAERAKDEFVSLVSHELRTPLTAIVGALKLLDSGLVTQAQDTLLATASRNSARLLNLVNDLLDAQKIALGAFDLNIASSDVSGITRQTVQELQHLERMYDVRFELEIEDDLWANVDPKRWSQVLTNLLSNALKFSPAQERVTVSLKAPNESDIRLSITDRGPGIPEAFRDRIFEKFAQADMSSARPHSGTGLGLSLCKSIVEAHGGHIGFDSAPGQHTTFWTEWPVRISD